jgi:TPR repeat protein
VISVLTMCVLGGCTEQLRPDRAVVTIDVAALARATPRQRPAPKPAAAQRPRLLDTEDCSESPRACVAAGVRLTRTDLAHAARKFAGACDAGSPTGCGNLAVLLRDGRGVPPDPERADTLMHSACDEGNARACDELRLR